MKKITNKIYLISFLVIASILLTTGCQTTASFQNNKPLIEEYDEQIYEYFDEALSPMSIDYLEEYSLPFDWRMEGEENSTIYNFHSFRVLDKLFFQYQKNGDINARATIIDWICNYLDYDKGKTQDIYYAWSDDSVARRVYRFSYWSYLFQNDIPDEYMNKMLEELAYEAEMLTDEDFYNKNHNHGMYQDMGLIAYAVLWADDTVRNDYLQLAKERSEEYFDYVFTSEGVHKEHSPRYGYDIAKNLLFYSEIYKQIDNAFSQKCIALYEGCGDYFAIMTMPNGNLPSLGDSPEFAIEESYWEDNPWYQYVASDGEHGEIPPDNYIFPESGYAVMRSSWEDEPEQATYLLFTAATYSSTHKHSDDLNFLLYHDGPLFVEAGKRDYDYTNPETAYAYSNYGHNVMLVNGEGFPIYYAESGAQRISSQEMPTAQATGITGYDMAADVAWVEGKQYRYHNATQTRSISYDKTVENADAQVMVKDTVEATEQLSAEFLYHIAPGVQVEETSTGWNLWRDGVLAAEVECFSDAYVEHRTITGIGEGNYSTAIYNGNEQAQYGAVLVLKVDCKKGTTESGIKITLSPQASYKTGSEFKAINRLSETAVEIPSDRPYGPYFIQIEIQGQTIKAKNSYVAEGLSYAWEVFDESKSEQLYYKSYSDESIMSYEVKNTGVYYVKAWILDSEGQKTATYTAAITIEL